MHCMIVVEDCQIGKLFIVLVFGSVLENAGELGIVEVALLVNRCFPEELVHVLICEAVSHGGQQLPQVVLVDDTWSSRKNRNSERVRVCVRTCLCYFLCVLSDTSWSASTGSSLTRSFLVETRKRISDDVLWVCAVQAFSKHGEEHCEVDGARSLTHHSLQVLVRWVLTCKGEHMKIDPSDTSVIKNQA